MADETPTPPCENGIMMMEHDPLEATVLEMIHKYLVGHFGEDAARVTTTPPTVPTLQSFTTQVAVPASVIEQAGQDAAKTLGSPAHADRDEQPDSTTERPAAVKPSRFDRVTPIRSRRAPRAAVDDSGTASDLALPAGVLIENASMTLSFQTRDEATSAMVIDFNTWSPPSPDDSIPTTMEQRRTYVLRLLLAFVNKEDCINIGKTNGWKENKPLGYTNKAMEKVCWDIVYTAERLHTEGPGFLSIYDARTRKDIDKDSKLTFEQRISHLVAMLALLKSRCDEFMRGSGIQELVAAPRQKILSTPHNIIQNLDKQAAIDHGRKALGLATSKGRRKKALDDGDGDGDGEEDIAAPVAAIEPTAVADGDVDMDAGADQSAASVKAGAEASIASLEPGAVEKKGVDAEGNVDKPIASIKSAAVADKEPYTEDTTGGNISEPHEHIASIQPATVHELDVDADTEMEGTADNDSLEPSHSVTSKTLNGPLQMSVALKRGLAMTEARETDAEIKKKRPRFE